MRIIEGERGGELREGIERRKAQTGRSQSVSHKGRAKKEGGEGSTHDNNKEGGGEAS